MSHRILIRIKFGEADDCRACGVRVEAAPWGIGKHQLTKAYMLFLAYWVEPCRRTQIIVLTCHEAGTPRRQLGTPS
jgi:hypothetical protein